MCLYSEVCLLLSEYAFRLFSRRFLQELFMDVDFKELYFEPYEILKLEDGHHNNGIKGSCEKVNIEEKYDGVTEKNVSLLTETKLSPPS